MTRPNGAAALRSAIRALLAEQLHTAIPATIEAYAFKEQRASILPTVERQLSDGRRVAYPVITNVPVVWPRGENCSLTMPLRRGNAGLAVFSEQALEDWLQRGGMQAPGAPRQFDLTDAVFIPGCYPFPQPGNAENNEDVLLMHGADKIRLKPKGMEFERGASKMTMTDDGIRLEADTLEFHARKVWKRDLNGYGETDIANTDGTYTFNSWTIDAIVGGAPFPIAPSEHEPRRVKL